MMRSLESWMLSYLLNSLWQVPMLAAAGWVAARVLRRMGAVAEHRVWVAVLVLQAALPASPMLPDGWLRAIFSRPNQSGAEGNVSVVFGPGAAMGGAHFPSLLLTLVAVAYACVTAYFIARYLWRSLQLASLRRHASELTLSPTQADILARARQNFGIENVALRVTPELRVPVTLGLTRSFILLPASLALELSDLDFRTVIEHELAHIRRHDFARNLAYELLSLPLSYHPLLRLTRESITETREMICDQLAAEHTGAMEYGRSLLRLASLLVGTPLRSLQAIGIFDSNSLERRLMRLKHAPNTIEGTRRLLVITACGLLAFATCASALALRVKVLAPFPAALAADSTQPPNVISAAKAAEHVRTKVPPKYPVDAKKAGIQGTVVLKATISKDGAIENLDVVSGPEELRQSSLDAVRQWTYEPFMMNGEPVEVETTINVIYTLAR